MTSHLIARNASPPGVITLVIITPRTIARPAVIAFPRAAQRQFSATCHHNHRFKSNGPDSSHVPGPSLAKLPSVRSLKLVAELRQGGFANVENGSSALREEPRSEPTTLLQPFRASHSDVVHSSGDTSPRTYNDAAASPRTWSSLGAFESSEKQKISSGDTTSASPRLWSSLCASCVLLALLNSSFPALASPATDLSSIYASPTLAVANDIQRYSLPELASSTEVSPQGYFGIYGEIFQEALLPAPPLESELTSLEGSISTSISSSSSSSSRSSSGTSTLAISDNATVLTSPPSVASPSSSPSTPSLTFPPSSLFCPPPSPTNLIGERFAPDPEVTDQSVVLEAWEVVNETFFDARNKGWSPEAWAAKKEAIIRKPPRSRGEAYAMISSMLASLNDPYSRFVTPKQFAALAKYDVTGIGLNIGEDVEDGRVKLKVAGIVLGSPSQLAGVRQGDELVSVDGTSVQGMSAFDVSSLIQGPKGTPVTIGIRHDSCSPIELLTMARTSDVQSPVLYRLDRNDPISPLGLFQDFSSAASSSYSSSPSSPSSASSSSSSPSSMFSSVFSSSSAPTGPVGYIRLKEFNAAAKRDMVTAIQRLEAAGAVSFVLDLQDNPGGLVQSGVEIAKLFLERGQTVVYTEGRPGELPQKRSIEATGKPLTRAPLTVLVNGRTASASEIVAGALHDNCRAVLVGSRTFGKGLIQSVYELNDGSGMVVTVGKYVTPGLVDIDGNGIAADFRRKPSGDMARWKLANCQVPSS
ncbi:hypothetical protein CLOM_g18259 [Closterium sp. NIES-68]|nr:hypothetical protein CLOM_g18259 [Closterium sp. NIES-68]GJP63412.1 hypothetical protein CLOP_g20497 [Closterium sp. NIES-67]